MSIFALSLIKVCLAIVDGVGGGGYATVQEGNKGHNKRKCLNKTALHNCFDILPEFISRIENEIPEDFRTLSLAINPSCV